MLVFRHVCRAPWIACIESHQRSVCGGSVNARAILDMTSEPRFKSATGGTPLSAIEIACRAAQALTASGAARRGLKAGAPAPGFSLYDCEGGAVSLSGALSSGPAVVTFHGGLWCPTCIADLQALEAALPEYTCRGATLLAISPQTPNHNRAVKEEAGISFPLLADPRNRVAASYGVLVKLTPRSDRSLQAVWNRPAGTEW